jgi:hypothetical protein
MALSSKIGSKSHPGVGEKVLAWFFASPNFGIAGQKGRFLNIWTISWKGAGREQGRAKFGKTIQWSFPGAE